MKKYRTLISGLRRSSVIFASLVLASGAVLPLLFSSSASAGEITARRIELSSAVPSASSVTYTLTFTPVTTAQELIVDFCGDTPIIGSTCAFSASTVPNVSGVTSSLGTVATVGSGSPVHTIKVTGLTMTGGSPFTISFSGISNPTSATSFYARVLTYATGNSGGYVPASSTGGTTTTGTYIDAGGDALSTTTTIAITATVMEQLTFCVSVTNLAPTNTCTSATSPNLTLGQGSPAVLSTSTVSTGADYTQLSTNAISGAVVNLKALNTCDGLSSNGGTSCGIPGIGTFAAPAAGQAFFGLNVSTSTNDTNGSGTVTPSANYGSTSGSYGMGTNVNTTYGDTIASSTGPTSWTNNTLTWGAQASNVTPAGVYTANESLIATGTF